MLRIITCAVCVMVNSSCIGIGGKDQLEYENTPYKKYSFGENDELSMLLPIPILSGRGSLYSNLLRREWVGGGFIDYFPISSMKVIKNKNIDVKNMIYIRYNTAVDNGYILSREFVVIINNMPIMLNVVTCPSYGKEHIDRYITEDDALFIKVLESVRVKGDDGKIYKIKVDYDKLAEKMKEIAFKPNKPSNLFETPYELIETEPMQDVK